MKATWVVLWLLVAVGVASGSAQADGGSMQTTVPSNGRGAGMAPERMGQGIVGTVTKAGSDAFTVKTFTGEIYTVEFSANTRILSRAGAPQGSKADQGAFMRTPPTPIKASEIRVGDTILARGQMDAAGKSLGAMAIVKLDPRAARRLLTMEQGFGKTWLAGRVTAIDGDKVAVEGGPVHGSYSFFTDEKTTFRNGLKVATEGDLKVGLAVRVEGSMKDGKFVASRVDLLMIRAMGGPVLPHGAPPQ